MSELTNKIKQQQILSGENAVIEVLKAKGLIPDTTINYVAGFMFDFKKERVALIKKVKPEWQKGLLNGIGGKIEINETAAAAMVREFEEETGFKTMESDWFPLIKMKGTNGQWVVNFFFCTNRLASFEALKTTTDEEIVIIDLIDLDIEPVIPNLRWIIPMCLDGNVYEADVRYS